MYMCSLSNINLLNNLCKSLAAATIRESVDTLQTIHGLGNLNYRWVNYTC